MKNTVKNQELNKVNGGLGYDYHEMISAFL